MGRPAIDELSQDQLTSELKRFIDSGRHALNPAAQAVSRNQVIALVRANPTSSLRSHVLHNLGCRRRRWLRETSQLLPRSEISDILWRMGCPKYDNQPVTWAMEDSA